MDFNRVDGITGTIRVKGIGSEQSRRNRDQQQEREEEHKDESGEHAKGTDRVSLAALNQIEELLPATKVARVESDTDDDPADHPHIDTTV